MGFLGFFGNADQTRQKEDSALFCAFFPKVLEQSDGGKKKGVAMRTCARSPHHTSMMPNFLGILALLLFWGYLVNIK